jgi:alkylation response protein AidB-like acyl-CoA dehydrogenase
MIGSLSATIERERRLPPQLLAELHRAGLFRLLLPRSQNGLETDPLTFLEVMETVARADASTAWNLCQAGGCAMSAAYLDHTVAWEIFGGDPEAVLAWGPGHDVRAVVVDGGCRLTGTWSFNSGGRHATWLGAHCPIYEPDGTPRRDREGNPEERTFLVPASEVSWTDVWSVLGLRGTASDAFTLDGRFVPFGYSITRDWTKERREDGPLYHLSARALFAIGFAAIALGVARAGFDVFIDLARTKVPRETKRGLRDNAAVQAQTAQSEARLRSSLQFLVHTVGDTWVAVQRSGAFTLEQRMAIRLATTFCIHQARDALDFAYDAAGATAIFDSHPLERRFRDLHTLTQQLQGRASHLETVGAYLLGAEPDLTFV